jgi:hypothetical protein
MPRAKNNECLYIEDYDVRAASTTHDRRRQRSESIHDTAPSARDSTSAGTIRQTQQDTSSHRRETPRRLPEPSPAPHPPTGRNSVDVDTTGPFSGHPSAARYNVSATGDIRSARTGRSPVVCKWDFYTYDAPWTTRGLSITSDLLPPGVEYICGQPERNTTADGNGVPRQHFQGFVCFNHPTTRTGLRATLKLQTFGAIPVGNDMVQNRINYTKKPESAVLDENGQSMWKEAGKVPENQKRTGDKHSEIVECIKNGGCEMDVLEMHPQMGIQYLGNISRMVGLYSKPDDRPDLQVYFIYGATRVGKSHFIRRILSDGDNSPVFNKPHPSSPTSTDFWPHNYNGATRVLFDDWHPRKYNIIDMLNYLQEYAMSVQTKGGYVAAKWNRVYITSNVPIDTWYDHLPDGFKGNIEALKARIPVEHRMVMHRRPPPEMRSCTFEEMKRYQDGLTVQDNTAVVPATRSPAALQIDSLSEAQLRDLLKRLLTPAQ